MQSPIDLWETIGELPNEELPLVLTKLFETYESMLENDSSKSEAQSFFNNLGNAIVQTTECNLNRR